MITLNDGLFINAPSPLNALEKKFIGNNTWVDWTDIGDLEVNVDAQSRINKNFWVNGMYLHFTDAYNYIQIGKGDVTTQELDAAIAGVTANTAFINILGQQVFVYDQSGTPETSFITLTATPVNTTEQGKWQYQSGTTFIDIAGATNLTYTITPNSALFQGANQVVLRYYISNTLYNIITIYKVYQGQSAYTVVVNSSFGTQFSNGNINTTLQALVYEGGTDITSTIDASYFKWTRKSSDSTSDIIWNNHLYTGTTLNITIADVDKTATFTCTVTIN